MMNDERKTNAELIQELKALRSRVVQQECQAAEHKGTLEELRESEGKWRSLVENVPDIVMTLEPDGTIRFINRTVSGMTVEQTLGTKVYDYIFPEYHDTMRKSIERVFQTGTPNNYELVGVGPGGSTSWYEGRVGPIVQRGRVVAVSCIVTDVTGRKRAEEALKESEGRYRVLFQGSAQGILVADTETRQFKYANPAICKMLGYTAEELNRMAVYDIHPEEHLEHVICEFDAQARGERTLSSDIPCLRRDGTILYADINSSRVVIGEREYNVGFFADVTERKKTGQALNELGKRVAQTERLASLGALAATMVHEMAQPLTVIRVSTQNALEELKRVSPSHRLREYLEDGITEIESSISVIERFRDFARVASEDAVYKVEVATILGRILSLLDSEIKAARLAVRLKRISGLPTIYANEAQLEQLFFALIQNAVQAIDDKVVHRLIISGVARDEHVELRFSDNGCGIAPESLDKVFDPFFTTKPKAEGTGLGLSIVEHVLAKMGGEVRVKSRPGKGSTFFLTIPVDENRGSWLEMDGKS